jgi:hypothetical protein
VGELVSDTVLEWALPDLSKAVGRPDVPDPKASAAANAEAVERLPVSAVARILMGVALHLGNSLLKSSRG